MTKRESKRFIDNCVQCVTQQLKRMPTSLIMSRAEIGIAMSAATLAKLSEALKNKSEPDAYWNLEFMCYPIIITQFPTELDEIALVYKRPNTGQWSSFIPGDPRT